MGLLLSPDQLSCGSEARPFIPVKISVPQKCFFDFYDVSCALAGMGKDHTLFSLIDGVVFFHKALRYIPGGSQRRRFISVIPMNLAMNSDYQNKVDFVCVNVLRFLVGFFISPSQVQADYIAAFEALRDKKVRQEAARIADPGYERQPLFGPDPFGKKQEWDDINED